MERTYFICPGAWQWTDSMQELMLNNILERGFRSTHSSPRLEPCRRSFPSNWPDAEHEAQSLPGGLPQLRSSIVWSVHLKAPDSQ